MIETSEKVKESIDTQQNKLIKQLQDNQLALTAGFEGNRKAITSGFDKVDEVKKSDLLELTGYEAIEHPEMKESKEISEEPGYLITRNDFILLDGGDAEDVEDGEELIYMEKELFDEMLSDKNLNEDKYTIKINTKNPGNPIVEVVEREQGEKKRKRGCNT